jgi:hypothetical protein
MITTRVLVLRNRDGSLRPNCVLSSVKYGWQLTPGEWDMEVIAVQNGFLVYRLPFWDGLGEKKSWIRLEDIQFIEEARLC